MHHRIKTGELLNVRFSSCFTRLKVLHALAYPSLGRSGLELGASSKPKAEEALGGLPEGQFHRGDSSLRCLPSKKHLGGCVGGVGWGQVG